MTEEQIQALSGSLERIYKSQEETNVLLRSIEGLLKKGDVADKKGSDQNKPTGMTAKEKKAWEEYQETRNVIRSGANK